MELICLIVKIVNQIKMIFYCVVEFPHGWKDIFTQDQMKILSHTLLFSTVSCLQTLQRVSFSL